MLGIFAEYGVYFASIWSLDQNEYQLSAINMFTNYNGDGGKFGDTLVNTVCGNDNISVHSSIDGEDDSTVKIIAVNKSIHDETAVNITVSSENKYASSEVFELYGDSTEIRRAETIEKITDNSFVYNLKPLSVTEFVVHKKEKKVPVIPIAAGAAVLASAGIFAAVKIKKGK